MERNFCRDGWDQRGSGRNRGFCRTNQIPKHLSFSGDEDSVDAWRIFRFQLVRFFESCSPQVQEQDRINILMSILKGRALYIAVVNCEAYPRISYENLFARLESRFDGDIRVETAHLELQNTRQRQGESLDVWADRVWRLVRLTANNSEAIAVMAFCMGCTDKENGLKVLERDAPSLLHEAVGRVKWLQQLRLASGRRPRNDMESVQHQFGARVRLASEERQEEVVRFQAVQKRTEPDVAQLSVQMDRKMKLDQVTDEVRELSPCLKMIEQGSQGMSRSLSVQTQYKAEKKQIDEGHEIDQKRADEVESVNEIDQKRADKEVESVNEIEKARDLSSHREVLEQKGHSSNPKVRMQDI